MDRREYLIQLLGGFLAQIRETGDLALALAPSVTAAAAELAGSLDENSVDIEAHYLLGWLCWHQAAVLSGEQRQAAIDHALEMLTPTATLIGRAEFPGPLLPALADRAVPAVIAAFEHARLSQDTAMLSDAIDCFGHVLAATPEERPEFAHRLSILSGALLIRFQQAGDPRDVENALDAARRSVRLGAGDRDVDAYLLNLCGILKTRYSVTREAADLDAAIDAGREAVAAASAEDRLPAALTNLNGALLERFGLAGRKEDLAAAIDAARRAVATAHPAEPQRAAMLNNLAKALHEGVIHGGPAADLDEALNAARRAVQAGAGQPDEGMFLSNLVDVLQSRFKHSGLAEDLDEAVTASRGLVSITRGSGKAWAGHLLTLASCLADRFVLGGDPADLNELVSVNWQAVEADPGSSALLTALGNGLLQRHARSQATADLDEATAVARRAVEAAGPAEPGSRPFALLLLERALWTGFELSGALDELDEVIATRRAIVEMTAAGAPERGERLARLGHALLSRFEKEKDPRNLDEAVDRIRMAVQVAPESDRWYRLADLCAVLFARYTLQEQRSDLDAAAGIARGAAGRPVAEELPAGVLLNFAHLLDQRARVAGALDDLDVAIGLVRRAVSVTAGSPSPPADRASAYIKLRADDIWPERPVQSEPDHKGLLRVLNAYVTRRFEWTEVLAFVDEAIRIRRQLLATTSDAEHAVDLASLSYALKSRFGRTGDVSNLDEAVETGRRALDLDPGNATYLMSLSNTLHLRFDSRNVESDLEDAIDMGRRAAEVRADEPAAWANLSALLLARFDLDAYSKDLEEALAAARHAVSIGEQVDVDRPRCLYALAEALYAQVRHAARRSGSLEQTGEARLEADRSEALSVISELMHLASAPPRLRVRSAKAGALLAVEGRAPGTEDPRVAADLLEAAIHLLPDIAPRSMRHHEQRDAIRLATGLADNAAAVALAAADRPPAERAERALSLLEAGRAVLLNQLMDTRGDLTGLRRVRPELADRLTALRDFLDRDTDPATHDGADRFRAAAELAATLGEIRTMDGFATFALPPTSAELLAAAQEGPVVSFTVAYQANAILLTKDGIDSLALPALTAPVVIDQVNAFYVALRDAYDPAADRVAAQDTLTGVLKWLWDNVTGPVLDALGYRGTPAEGTPWPRLWWAPGGYLSLLPLHAAGYHDDPARGRTVMDRVVSSYTPTIRTLRHARQRQAGATAAADRSLIVAMPTTPGHSELRNVRTETELLTRDLPDPLVLTEPDRPQVLAELPGRRIVHFACHGNYEVDDPANSGLLLRDHEQSPLTVGEISAVNLDDAQLAYLSACHTAVNVTEGLLDEAMHLAGALQAAGFPQVVGTLWEVDDEVAVDITEDFYRGLRASDAGTLDLGRAARSLHRAVRTQRDEYPGTPSLWAAHLHFGT